MSRFCNAGINKNRNKNILNKADFIAWLLLLPTILMLIYTKWTPVMRGLFVSFFKTKGFETERFVGLENYKNVITDTLFLQTLTNSALYVVWSLIIGFIPALLLALLINEVVHGKSVFRLLTYLPSMVPGLSVALIFNCIYSPNAGGLLNTILNFFNIAPKGWLLNEGLVIPLIVISMTWQGCAGTALIYLAALQGVSQDLYEAAMIDGAGVWRRLFKITIPQIFPTILLMFVNQIIGVFQIMHQPLVMTDGGPVNASMSLNLSAYKMAFSYMQVDRALALGTVTFVILIIITIFYLKMDKKLND